MYIYKITNNINGKIYIGQSCKSPNESTGYYGSGIAYLAAESKYGKENFIKEILEDGIESKDVLNEREVYWISTYESTNKNIGYNLTIGGGGTSGFKHGKQSDETKIKRGIYRKGYESPSYGKPKTIEARKKMAESHKGLTHSEETKKKMSDAQKGKKKEKVICPFCNTEGGEGAMKRWHFNNCKHAIK